ncbi:hypothetical protein [Neolewinella agarilytica]|uniref:Uncharacterized protein n=1 Tax=Neolewinella agarilytica TaxID=478744 RepID=A0A1H9LSD9_9BACT|nr:hypothetical protein [Neolewinella agarilytica]SER14228.1 hypothetical protein SAMN05444359_12550 [Neolewinella agarilytica]
MEPINPNKPSTGLFILMSAVYFGAYFGLKYGVLGGELPWMYNLILILVCLGLALLLHRRGQKS